MRRLSVKDAAEVHTAISRVPRFKLLNVTRRVETGTAPGSCMRNWIITKRSVVRCRTVIHRPPEALQWVLFLPVSAAKTSRMTQPCHYARSLTRCVARPAVRRGRSFTPRRTRTAGTRSPLTDRTPDDQVPHTTHRPPSCDILITTSDVGFIF